MQVLFLNSGKTSAKNWQAETALTAQERKEIDILKIDQYRLEDQTFRGLGSRGTGGIDGRGQPSGGRHLTDINRLHATVFQDVVRRLSRRYPNETIRILDEGAGQSPFFEEVRYELQREVEVEVIRTDLCPNRMPKDPSSPTYSAAPEELLERFGQNSIHLVVSTMGGIAYTPVSQRKAVANVLAMLIPGGEAYLFTNSVPGVFTGAKTVHLFALNGLLDRHPEIEASECENLQPKASEMRWTSRLVFRKTE